MIGHQNKPVPATAYADEFFGRGTYTITAVITPRDRLHLCDQLRDLRLGDDNPLHTYPLTVAGCTTLLRFFRAQPDLHPPATSDPRTSTLTFDPWRPAALLVNVADRPMKTDPRLASRRLP
jgi:hypothetical protein